MANQRDVHPDGYDREIHLQGDSTLGMTGYASSIGVAGCQPPVPCRTRRYGNLGRSPVVWMAWDGDAEADQCGRTTIHLAHRPALMTIAAAVVTPVERLARTALPVA
jgi:hypothetical protein